jgi:transposase InsO family protein
LKPSPKGSNATKNNSASSPSHPDDEPFRSTAQPRELRLAGQSYDNALAEAVNAAYKSELINRGKPWRCIDDVELATAQWVFWYNEERLHETLGYVPPAEYEAALTGASHPASRPTPALATE